MASQLTKRGYKYRSLPTNDTDTFGDFLNDDSEFNIKKLDTDLEKLDDKVILEGKRQQKFDFIENQVVQDGLVNKIIFTTSPYYVSMPEKVFSMQAKIGDGAGWLCYLETSSYSTGFGVNFKADGVYISDTADQKGLKKVSDKKSNFILTYMVDTINNILTVGVDNEFATYVFSYNSFIQNKIVFKSGVYNGSVGFLYNRILTPQEIQHNFSVLNNSPSIKELHTTDSTGKTSILPTLYKESKKARGTLIEIPYDEPRDLENYIYKFI